jgi:hypothetical protein
MVAQMSNGSETVFSSKSGYYVTSFNEQPDVLMHLKHQVDICPTIIHTDVKWLRNIKHQVDICPTIIHTDVKWLQNIKHQVDICPTIIHIVQMSNGSETVFSSKSGYNVTSFNEQPMF